MNDNLKAHRDFQQVMDDSMTFAISKIPICYDDDDDEYSFATQEYLKKFSSAITPDLPKSDSLIMEDKHFDTIPETESDELIKSSVEDLVHTPIDEDERLVGTLEDIVDIINDEIRRVPENDALVFYGPQRNSNEPPMYLYNKDFFYLKNGNTKEKKYVLSLHKIHATPFLEDDLVEHLTRWIRKEFRTFNKEARLSIQHYKDTWHNMYYIIMQRNKNLDPKEVFTYHKIVEVVRITTDQKHRLDFMEEII
ncbi:hypothetical protein Tco_1322282 [Tanacetum coccineum]